MMQSKTIPGSARFLSFLCVSFSLTCLFSSQADCVILVRGGRAAVSIVLMEDPSLPEQLAAEELRAYVRKISGAELDVFEGAAAGSGSRIIIGTLENSAGIASPGVLKTLENAESGRSFYLKTEGGNVFITGKTPVGALYGAYTLLEKTGVRWFSPGEEGEYVPERKTLELGEIDSFQAPSIERMSLNLTTASWEKRESMEWMARNKMVPWWQHGRRIYRDRDEERGNIFNEARGTDRLHGAHGTFRITIPADKYFESNPEYFALIDGERRGEGRDQRCVSNPEVRKLIEDYIVDYTLETGERFHFGAADTVDTWCQCGDCREMGTVDGKFSHTNLVHRYISRVVENVKRRNPDAKLSVWFYQVFRTPPAAEDVAYGENLMFGEYCSHQRCYVHTFNDPDCPANRVQYAEFREWQDRVPRVSLYDYMDISNCEYAPFEHVVAEDLKHLAEIGAYGWLDETPPVNASYVKRWEDRAPELGWGSRWLSRWQTYYAAAKIGWDSSIDMGELMDDAYDKYYGAAAPPMKEYHALRARLWENAPGHAWYGGPRRTAYCLTVPGAEEELLGYLEEAVELAAGDPLRLGRVEMDRKYLEHFWKKPAEEMKALFSVERSILPRRVSGDIIIDAELSEDCWLAARPVEEFLGLRSRDVPVERTSVRVLYDDEYLYFGITAMNEHAWTEPKADALERDGQVWMDDSVEILLAPPDPAGEGIYYHVMSNTEGIVYDARCEGSHFDTSYDSKVEVKVRKLPDRQVYEFKIPVGPMGTEIVPGQTWGMHFVRNCHSLQPPVSWEVSAVDGTRPHRVSEFRRAAFGESVIKNGSFNVLVPLSQRETWTNRGIIGEEFAKGWHATASECEIIEGISNRLRLKRGAVFQRVRPAGERSARPGTLALEINAYGEGEIHVRMRTQVSRPELPSGERVHTDLDRFELGDEPSTYNFRYSFEEYEHGLVYIFVSGEAFINYVSGILAEK